MNWSLYLPYMRNLCEPHYHRDGINTKSIFLKLIRQNDFCPWIHTPHHCQIKHINFILFLVFLLSNFFFQVAILFILKTNQISFVQRVKHAITVFLWFISLTNCCALSWFYCYCVFMHKNAVTVFYRFIANGLAKRTN